MKIKLSILFFVCLGFSNLYSQHKNYYSFDSLETKSVEEGKVLFDIFYGGPNLNGGWLSTLIDFDSSSSVRTETEVESTTGPLGTRVDYMIDDKNSIGLEISYSAASVIVTNTNFNTTTPIVTKERATYSKFRLMPRYCYHFKTDKIDWFYHIGAGMVSNKAYIPSNKNNLALIPVFITVRTGIGMRYYFNENWGLNADAAIGGPFFTLGISGSF